MTNIIKHDYFPNHLSKLVENVIYPLGISVILSYKIINIYDLIIKLMINNDFVESFSS